MVWPSSRWRKCPTAANIQQFFVKGAVTLLDVGLFVDEKRKSLELSINSLLQYTSDGEVVSGEAEWSSFVRENYESSIS